MNYKSFNLGDWIGHISGAIEDESTLDGNEMRNLVCFLTTLKQEQKTGRWIGHREHCENLGVMPSGLGAYEWCSNCDCSIDVREWHRNNYNFCPNCGAKMVDAGK